ncbi:MAG: Dabb family protein [Nocardioidaceae bacterium]
MSLQHVVLFKFPENVAPELLAELDARVRAWPSEIAGIEVLRLGTDLTGDRTRGHQLLLYMEFADVESLRAYQTHPVHAAFLAWVLEYGCVPLAFDYLLDKTTVIVGDGV